MRSLACLTFSLVVVTCILRHFKIRSQIFFNHGRMMRSQTSADQMVRLHAPKAPTMRTSSQTEVVARWKLLEDSKDSCMAGLIGARVCPNNPSCHHQHSSLCSFFSRHLLRVSYHFPAWRVRSYNTLTMVASSVQPSKTMAPTQFDNILPSKEALAIWCRADAVCFDVDSTVCLDEGIDELADFCGAGNAVAEWTARAMTGSVPFEEALAARLSLFNPSSSQLQDFLEKRPPRISSGIDELIKILKLRKTDVYLISGGFRQMIEPVALHLGIPQENIFANRLLFGNSGEFLGFDTKESTSRSGGKATAVHHIRKVHKYNTLIMIGDGATDLEAKKPGGADLFICYAGVQLREAVATKADWLIFNFEDLMAPLL